MGSGSLWFLFTELSGGSAVQPTTGSPGLGDILLCLHTSGCHNWGTLLASSGWGPGRPVADNNPAPNVQCPGWKTRTYRTLKSFPARCDHLRPPGQPMTAPRHRSAPHLPQISTQERCVGTPLRVSSRSYISNRTPRSRTVVHLQRPCWPAPG